MQAPSFCRVGPRSGVVRSLFLDAFSTPILSALAAAVVSASGAAAAPLITEFSAANDATLYDEDGDSSDWIEVHNPDGVPVDLGGWFLTDDPGNLSAWRFPDTVLPAGGYLVVFASGKDRDVGELHTSFRLPASGGYLALVEPDGTTVASEFPAYPGQPDDFSYGLAQSGSVETLTFIPEDSACRLLVPTTSLGTGWTDPGFDDGGWRDATTGVGYERSSGYENLLGANGDVEPETYGTTGTVYVRIPFTVDDLDGISRLVLRMKYDDGFVAWLNGTEVASANAPANPAWDSSATADHSDGLAVVFEDFDLSAQLNLLRSGRNVLAIQGLNNGTTSSDFLILPQLDGERVTDPGLGGAGYFRTPTPGTLNGSAAEQGLPAEAVRISPPGRGFSSGSVSVSMAVDSPSAEIRYTTDGSTPTATSPRFTGAPVNVTSSTLVRARAFAPGLAPGPVVEQAYIALDSSARTFSSNIPVVVMENFGGGPTASNGKTFTFFAVFEPDPGTGRTVLDKPYALGTRGGWKVRGSSSAGFAKKSYSIEAWNEFNRNRDIAPLGMPEESDWILSGRYTFDRALMRNPLIYRLSNEVGRYAVRTEFVELFKNDSGGSLSFNGDYDGVYTFMEKITRDRDRVDVERLPESVTSEPGIAGGYMLKIDRLDPGDSGLSAAGQSLGWVYPKEREVSPAQAAWMRDYLNAMNAALNAADFADPESGYARYLDPDAFVDHHLLNILTLNADALRLSTYFFKRREGRVEMGPIWDFDRSMGSTDGRDANPETWQGGTNYFTYPWWNRLFADENFWQRYIDRWFELRQGPFSTANVHGIIEEFAARLDESQVRNFNRWPEVFPRFGSYRGEVNHLKDWLGRRLTWIDGQFVPRPTANRAEGVHPAGTTVTLSGSLTGGRRIIYTLDGSDPRPSGSVTLIGSTTIVDEQAPARALVPSSDPGIGWRGGSEPFNDAAWIPGTNGMGYDTATTYDPYININLEGANAMQNVSTSAMMRIRFDVDAADLATFNALMLEMRYDDGFVAWLNGTRVASANDPAGLSWDSGATQTNDDGSAVNFESFDISASLGALRAGANVLAIQGLNSGLTSSDFLIQARLVGGTIEGPNGNAGGIEYTGPIVLNESARLVARVFDPRGASSPNSGTTPVGSPWSAPLRLEFLVNEIPADTSNLAITEIMHDPYPLGDALTGRGEFEFVELLNTGAQRISLTEVRFTEGIAFDFTSADIFSLAPGDRVVIVRNRAAFEQVYGSVLAARVAGEFTGALDNAGESLVLRDRNGALIQSLAFGGPGFPDDAGDGRSLVLVGGDPQLGASWSASRALLGTPGYDEAAAATVPPIVVNEILSNSVVPAVDAIELHNPTNQSVDLGGWLLTDDLGRPAKFTIPSGTVIAPGGFVVFTESDFNATPGSGTSFALASSGEEVFLVSARPDGTRTGHVDGFAFLDASADVSFGRHVLSTGAVSHPPMSAQTFGAANASPLVGPLVIDEIMFHPPDGGIEFVEIRNASSEPVPLDGVEVGGIGWTFGPLAPVLDPGAIVLLVETDPQVFHAAVPVPPGVPVFGPYPGKLDNGGESLTVRMPEPASEPSEPDLRVVVDEVAYDDRAPWPTGTDGDGRSLQRIDRRGFGSDPIHWQASAEAGGTPGTGPGDPPPSDWRTAFFNTQELADPAISGDLADADGDGVANAAEFVLGSDLRDAGSTARPEVALIPDGTGRFLLELTFPVRDGADAFFTIHVDESRDLASWSDVTPAFAEVSRLDPGNGTLTLTLRRTQPVSIAESGPLLFRLRFEEAP